MKDKLNARKNSLSSLDSVCKSERGSLSTPDEDEVLFPADSSTPLNEDGAESDVEEYVAASSELDQANTGNGESEASLPSPKWDSYRNPLSPSSGSPSGSSTPSRKLELGQLDKPEKRPSLRLRVYDTYMSRRASHLIGADYTLQAAQLQASAGTPMDLLPKRRVGQFDPPVVDRVTDPVHSKLESNAKELAEVARATKGQHSRTSQISVDDESALQLFSDVYSSAAGRFMPSPEVTSSTINWRSFLSSHASSDSSGRMSGVFRRTDSLPFQCIVADDWSVEGATGSSPIPEIPRSSTTLVHSVSDIRFFSPASSGRQSVSSGSFKKRAPGAGLVARRPYPRMVKRSSSIF